MDVRSSKVVSHGTKRSNNRLIFFTLRRCTLCDMSSRNFGKVEELGPLQFHFVFSATCSNKKGDRSLTTAPFASDNDLANIFHHLASSKSDFSITSDIAPTFVAMIFSPLAAASSTAVGRPLRQAWQEQEYRTDRASQRPFSCRLQFHDGQLYAGWRSNLAMILSNEVQSDVSRVSWHVVKHEILSDTHFSLPLRTSDFPM